MVNAVIFDFDGTLADTQNLIINSFQTVYRQFQGQEKPVDYIIKCLGEPVKVTFQREFPQQPFDEIFSVFKNYQIKRFMDDVRLFDNAVEMLQYLKAKNIKTGIVTSRMRDSVISALQGFDIEKYFDIIIAVNDTENHKPHPEPLLKAMDLLNTTPTQVLYVGDSKFDMECANNAAVTPVLVSWSTDLDNLNESYNVKYIVDNLYDITKLI